MKLTILASIILSATVAAGPAHASWVNGTAINGIKLNAVTGNGTKFNAVTGNGTKFNAVTGNGTKFTAVTGNGTKFKAGYNNGTETGGKTVWDLDGPKADLCVTGAEPDCEQTSTFTVLSVTPGAETPLQMH
jgi:hypothetical protein